MTKHITKMVKIKKTLLLVSLTCAIAACGNKGPLYQEQEPSAGTKQPSAEETQFSADTVQLNAQTAKHTLHNNN